MNGWISLHRQIMDNPLYFSEKFTKTQAWIDLLLLASTKNSFVNARGCIVRISRGQVGWSKERLAQRWRWSRRTVARFLDFLEESEQISQKKEDPRRKIIGIITIRNFNFYQKNTTECTTECTTESPQEEAEKTEKKEKNAHQNTSQNTQHAQKNEKKNDIKAENVSVNAQQNLRNTEPKNEEKDDEDAHQSAQQNFVFVEPQNEIFRKKMPTNNNTHIHTHTNTEQNFFDFFRADPKTKDLEKKLKSDGYSDEKIRGETERFCRYWMTECSGVPRWKAHPHFVLHERLESWFDRIIVKPIARGSPPPKKGAPIFYGD